MLAFLFLGFVFLFKVISSAPKISKCHNCTNIRPEEPLLLAVTIGGGPPTSSNKRCPKGQKLIKEKCYTIQY